MGIFDWKSWIVILIVVVLVFGTKKLKNAGSDLGSALRGFKKALNEEDSEEQTEQTEQKKQNITNNSVATKDSDNSSPTNKV